MKPEDVKCPICGTVNHDLYLFETDGWMECEHCGYAVRLLNADAKEKKGNYMWQVIKPLPSGRLAV